MKCPKCDYLSFETGDRCRNCGYDFSLTIAPPAAGEVKLAALDEVDQPLDLALKDPRGSTPATPSIDLDRLIGAPSRSIADLPLFAQDRGDADDRPLISVSAAPRPPLAVRRNVDTARRRAVSPCETPIELALEPPTSPVTTAAQRDASDDTAPPPFARVEQAAGWLRRAAAAAIDAAILASIDTLVVYLTARLCGLPLGGLSVLPLVPLVAFLALLNGGYLIAFTAIGGQTIGKMATGIQVVGDEGPVDVAHAVLRAAGYIVSLAPAGLGLVPAFFGDGRRALHDRLADTRVVRA